jgi:nucleosome binding factor SPN SPT16 subunit
MNLNCLSQIEAIIFDPSKIGVKVSSELVEICFTPIIQSGGKYDIKVSAQSNADILSSDIIICSLGARYKNYCANVSRTFIVDAPPKVEKTYATLIGLYDACLDQMVPGHELKDVIEAARAFLTKK